MSVGCDHDVGRNTQLEQYAAAIRDDMDAAPYFGQASPVPPAPLSFGRQLARLLIRVFLICALGFVGGGLFATWMTVADKPAFALGTCLIRDKVYERWEQPEMVLSIEEVGQAAYRVRRWYAAGPTGFWEGAEITLPFAGQSALRPAPCPPGATPEGATVPRFKPRTLPKASEHLRPRGLTE